MNKPPKNFRDKLNHRTFWEDAIEWNMEVPTNEKGVYELWLIPNDKFRDQIKYALLLEFPWSDSELWNSVRIKFCLVGLGKHHSLIKTHPITYNDLRSMDSFIDWCGRTIKEYKEIIYIKG